MFRLLSVLFGFAVFGALFAAVYYQPEETERTLPTPHPKFAVAPGDPGVDFIEPVAEGERITVNVTVIEGPPVHVLLVDFENLTTRSHNATLYGFELDGTVAYVDHYTRFNVTGDYTFDWTADGENRWVLMLFSSEPRDEELPLDNQTSQVAVSMRYIDREERSLLFGYLMATPSVVLIAYTMWASARRLRRGEDSGTGLVYPRDKDL
ncbi:MAG: hypothetical protein KY455_02690 [Euryarchaeota archaeon]|nr:hypothetical protein [Euryarchaeota archaeon]